MRKYKYVLLTAALLFVTQDAFSQPFGRGMGRGMGYWGAGYNYNVPYAGRAGVYGNPNAYYPPVLNLSQEQINKINDIQLKFQNENLDLISDLQKKNIELQNLLMVQPVDRNASNYKIEEINKLQAELQKKVLSQNEKLRNVLTDEQKAVYGNTAAAPGMLMYGRGIACAGLGLYGRGAGLGMGRRGMIGAGMGFYGRGYAGWGGRGPCGMGLGRGAGRGWW